ncbi:S-adenosylmethionine:tRNA ribosyltransferase-isomerase [Catalinimonas alkaloidigena]|uniref:S-adenosylmethionine:tRNA ribosyltransferase-isomerase n=1 Tax=Catalinimonas alkaloidigena TaxID=1075417 RepID=UPI002405746E|nr:S-adenosylmethionine:tRNA ribosyltransferase-isomerase [Catalinimonas alkaloidigena]MDF9798109.1 S-adenosylmethionine:tRNA ribosyltransferase-isomerase [Catalinimonas alkaloidigena]
MNREVIQLASYDYHLPDEQIARHPLEKRDQAKLLHYQNGKIEDRSFIELPELLPAQSHLFFNATKVIPARVFFQKPSTAQGEGAHIEVFLLNPITPSTIIGEAMLAKQKCSWHCMIGNKKKWRSDLVLKKSLSINSKEIVLSATLERSDEQIVSFSWDNPEMSFVDIVEAAGRTPLPPYLKREATDEDKPRYQTVYSAHEGAVAAPTAGLHFTPEVLKALENRGIIQDYLTLHVSAGTFQPIKAHDITQHPMHSEQMVVNKTHIERLLAHEEGKIIAVGTTSLRTLESLYWFGVLLSKDANASFKIPKLVAYQDNPEILISLKESMNNILGYMEKHRFDQLIGETEIFIYPGYKFRVCQGLITNFHLPKSTLILLIAALVGEDWKQIYQHALQNNYRFLSYGDSSLLLP